MNKPSILQDYNQHLKRNRNSLIIRFYGLHQVVWHDSNGKQQIRYITIMGNIFQCFQVGMRYDLKGSTQGRTLLRKGQKPEDRDPASLKTAMKDNDFTKYQKSVNFVELFANESDKRLKSPISQMKPDIKFKKHQSVRKEPQDLLEILESDARFLSRCSIIDYSLLLGEIVDDPLEVMATTELDPSLGKGVYWSESGQPYIIGVIDPLTCFNFQKQVEYSAKWLKHGTSMSCVPPNIYAQRFIDFCKRSFTTKIINDKKQHPVYNFASKNLKVPDLDKCRPHSGSAMALADDLLGQTAQFGSSQGTSKKKKPPVLDSLDLERANDTRI